MQHSVIFELSRVLSAAVVLCCALAPFGCRDVIDHGGFSTDAGATACEGLVPDSQTTGWQPVQASLTAYTGLSVLSTPGVVIDGADIGTCLEIAADNVTIRRSRIRTNQRCSLAIIAIRSRPNGEFHSGLLLEDVELDGRADSGPVGNDAAISGSGMTVRRANIHGVRHGIHLSGSQPTVVQSSWVHDLAPRDGNNTIHSSGSSNSLIEGNALENSFDTNGVIAFFGDDASNTNHRMVGNLLNGGSFSFYGGDYEGKPYPQATEMVFVRNCFGRRFFANGGFYGPVTAFNAAGPGNVWSENLWHDSREPVNP
jgi:hypothetical protein